jgi:exportin-1
MWAIKHNNREVEHVGINMCLELIVNMAETDDAMSIVFFRHFFVPLLQDVFVLTDPDQKVRFNSHAMLIARMFYFIYPADGTQPKIQVSIYDPLQIAAGTSNKEFLGGFVANLLYNAFPKLQS